MTREELKNRIDAVEEGYEFFLAYAAQGISGDAASSSGGQLRTFLRKMDEALTGLTEGLNAFVQERGLTPLESYHALIDVLDRDARATQAAVRVVLGVESISSQLVDNLNASIHVRALLTDLFLLDEILR